MADQISGLDAVIPEDENQPTYDAFEPLQRARSISKMTKEKALSRLQQGYDNIASKKRDQSAKWLRFAQAMLAPTKTGAFGESLGVASGALAGDVEAQQDFEIAREERLMAMQEKMAQAEEEYAEREIDILGEESDLMQKSKINLRGQPFDTYIEDPKDPNKKIRVKGMLREDGSWYVPRNKETGLVAILPDTLDPMTQFLRAQAIERGKLDPKTLTPRVEAVSAERNRLAKSYYGLTILDALDAEGNQTGGLQKHLQNFREFWGSSADDVTNRGILMNVMGQQLFESLKAFGTQINAKELAVAESLSGGIARPSGINRQMLQDLVRKLETTIGETIRLVGDHGTQLQKDMMETPMTDYGIGENLKARAQRIGLTLEEHIPFRDAPKGPEGPAAKTFAEGELGHVNTPFEPADMEEAAAIINDKANKGGHVKDPRTGKIKRI